MQRLRQYFEEHENQALASYALRSSRSRGRRRAETEDVHRTAYARDRDRIVHCGAFRRLEYKTQVVLSGQGDSYRTRLTHSLEVAQIARSVARVLALNEDVVEAVALAHDLGHPPFGHSGEEVLREGMREHGGFEHNVQALRIVDYLEHPYPDRQGLNLTFEVRDSILKHGPEPAGELGAEFPRERHPWLEAQVVDLADAIAYYAHDLDDGLRFGVFQEEDLRGLGLWDRAREEARRRYVGADPEDLLRPTLHQTLHLQVVDLMEESRGRLADSGVVEAVEARRTPARLVHQSQAMVEMQKELRAFLFANFYRSEPVEIDRRHAREVLRALFAYLLDHPDQLPESVQHQGSHPTDPHARVVCDYVAGMTDRYALGEHARRLGGTPEREP